MIPPAVRRISRSSFLGILVLLVLYLVYLGGGWAGIHAAELRQTSLVFAIATLGVWLAVAAIEPAWRPRTRLWPAFGAALLAFAAATVFSRFPRVSIEYLAWVVVLVALYLFLVSLLRDDWFRAKIGAMTVALCAITGAWYLFAVGTLWVEWWALVGLVAAPPLRPLFESLTLGNPSAVMTVCVLSLAVASAHLGISTPARRIGIALLVALTLFATVVSGSRAGWLGVAVATVVTPAIWLVHSGGRDQVRRRIAGAPRWWPVLLVPVVAIGVVAAPGIASRFNAGGEALRSTYYATATRMWSEAPLLGTGPGSWVIQRIRYTQAGEPDFYIPHAHNVYLQTLAEIGIVGIAAGVVVAAALAWLLREGIRSPDARRRRIGWAAVFTVAYFATHQLFDFYPSSPTVLFAFAIPVAWLDATTDRSLVATPLAGRRRTQAAAFGVGLAALVLAFGFLWRSESLAVRVSDGVSAANKGDWAAARDPVREATAGDPAIASYQLTLGLVLVRAGDHAGATDAFRAAATADGLPESWLNLAAEEAELGRPQDAREAIQEALRLGRQRPGIALAAGDLALRLGELDLARDTFVEALRLAPTLAGDPWWMADPLRAQAFSDALETSVSTSSGWVALVTLLEAGRISEAESVVGDLQSTDGTPELVLEAWSGDTAATDELIRRAGLSPIDGPVHWVALVLGHRDDPRADGFKRWADTRYAGTDPNAYEMRVIPTGSGVRDATSLASFYGHYTYRRPTPWDLLVPSLVHVRLR